MSKNGSNINSAVSANAVPADSALGDKIRDVLFAWLYTTVTQVNNIIANNQSSFESDLNRLKSDLQGKVQYLDDATLASFIASIKANDTAYTTVANALGNLDSLGWSGSTQHPSLAELETAFAPRSSNEEG